ncbi:hypothetical protein [Rhodococcus sp. IEGM1428]|uniref:hypothetical protein n=1 Tax=Rhodococcus sp. IEGM1428 TaxID=3392191 RepID=UPI003D0F9CA4
MSIYTSTTDRDSSITAGTALLGPAGIEYGYLTGANWVVNCGSKAVCVDMKAALGGKITAES